MYVIRLMRTFDIFFFHTKTQCFSFFPCRLLFLVSFGFFGWTFVFRCLFQVFLRIYGIFAPDLKQTNINKQINYDVNSCCSTQFLSKLVCWILWFVLVSSVIFHNYYFDDSNSENQIWFISIICSTYVRWSFLRFIRCFHQKLQFQFNKSLWHSYSFPSKCVFLSGSFVLFRFFFV